MSATVPYYSWRKKLEERRRHLMLAEDHFVAIEEAIATCPAWRRMKRMRLVSEREAARGVRTDLRLSYSDAVGNIAAHIDSHTEFRALMDAAYRAEVTP